jgi:hypothetical protein
MIRISHRGNLTGPNPEYENSPNYILNALGNDYDVEVDVWFKNNQFWLGHDEPKYLISLSFLQINKLWCHAKNVLTASVLNKTQEVHWFFHQEDDISITSNGHLWTYPGKELLPSHVSSSIAVIPERVEWNWNGLGMCNGICSDFIAIYSDKMTEARKINN